MHDIRQTSSYAKYLKASGWLVENKNGVNYFIKKFPVLGSFIKVQRPEKISYKNIELLSKKYRGFKIMVEPKNSMDAKYITQLGYKQNKSPYLPSKTLLLNLNISMNRFIEIMKKDARDAIKKTENLKIEEVRDLESFAKNWRGAVGWKKSAPSYTDLRNLKKSFGKNSLFIQASSNDLNHWNILAGGIFLISDGVGYYWKAFTSREGRKALAQYKVVWEGIKWAKKNRAKVVDFEGIYDERFPIDAWKGFTHFKKSFGGYEVEYPGAFSKLTILPR